MIYSNELFDEAREIIDARRQEAEAQTALRLAAF